MSKLPSYYIPSNLSEKQIEADVATYMGWCTPSSAEHPFRLLDVDEAVTGADKLFDVGAAIFMQFKKSGGLLPTQSVSTRKNKSKLEDIREFRREHGLADSPSLFFQLRAPAKHAADLQHNILLSYERPPSSRAIYVAPLLLDKKSYSEALYTSVRFLPYPFLEREFVRIYQGRWLTILNAVPFLREHISIPPHERVTTHDHYFSYSESGVDIAWHSPEVVTREPSRLSDFFSSLFAGIAADEGRGLQALDALASTLEEIAGQTTRVDGRSALDRLRSHGRWLRSTHGIRQFLLLSHSERLAEWRKGVVSTG